jgi:lactate dehydrogenase-like 2-hydroxyacid dehydrogenase
MLQYAPITERVVASLPKLGIVSRLGAGFDTIDTDACARHGVWVANSPDYGVGEVATHALALALALVRNIVAYHRDVHAGQWHFLSSGKLRRVGDMTLGIVGLGRIGKRMAHVSRNVFARVSRATLTSSTATSPPMSAVASSQRSSPRATSFRCTCRSTARRAEWSRARSSPR